MRNVFDAGRYIMWASGGGGGGLALGNESFLGPVKWHRADRVSFGAQKLVFIKTKMGDVRPLLIR